MSYNYDRYGFPTTVATDPSSGVRIKPTSQRCGLSGCGPGCVGCGNGLGQGSYVLSGNYRPLGVGLEGYNMEVSRLGAVHAGIAGGAQLRGLRGIWDTCGSLSQIGSSIAGMFTTSGDKSTSGTALDVQRGIDIGGSLCDVADAVDDRGGRRSPSADDIVAQAREDAGGSPPAGEATAAFDKTNLLIGLAALAAGVGLGFVIAR